MKQRNFLAALAVGSTLAALGGCAAPDAVSSPSPESLDCRHLMVRDVALSDQIEAQSHKAQARVDQSTHKGVEVRLDPMPGLGIKNGLTLSSATRRAAESGAGVTLENLEQQRTDIRRLEVRRACPPIPLPVGDQTRLSTDTDSAPR